MSTALDKTAILEELKLVFERASDGRIKPDEVHENADIAGDLSMDSLGQLELRFELERVWDAAVTDKEVNSVHTVGDIADLILQHLNAATKTEDVGV